MFDRPRRSHLLLGSLVLSGALLSLGCDEYLGAPRASIEGLEQGNLTDSKAPLRVLFDRAIDTETLRLKVVKYATDGEGNLADEDADDTTELDILYSYDATAKFPNEGGKGTLDDAGTVISIVPESPWPIAEKLALLVEEGLGDAEGVHKTIARERIVFTYLVELKCAPSADFVSGAYYFVGDVTEPIGTQVQLWSWIDVNPETGEFVASFVNADRSRDLARCAELGLTCEESEACRTIPEPACVPPSEKAASTDEYPDYVTNYTPPTGYSFQASGCVDGQSGDKTFFVNVPVDVVVQSPAVSLTGTVLTATFEKGDDGVLRGGGTIACDQVFLGTTPSGQAAGTISARLVPPGEEPADLLHPDPPAE